MAGDEDSGARRLGEAAAAAGSAAHTGSPLKLSMASFLLLVLSGVVVHRMFKLHRPSDPAAAWKAEAEPAEPVGELAESSQ